MFIAAAERRDAERRSRTITDLSAAIGGVLGGSKELGKHLDALAAFAKEET